MQNFNIINLFLIFKYQLITEKTRSLFTFNTYVFIVDRNVNKITIKLIIEYFFNVTVNKINILNIKNKIKKIGKFSGNKSKYKKVIVNLKINDNIYLFLDL